MFFKVAIISIIPVLIVSECIDSSTFTFTLDNDAEQDCAWLTKNASKITERKALYCGRGHVRAACQDSCDSCGEACADDTNFVFSLDSGILADCAWFGLDNSVNRIANYCFRGQPTTLAGFEVAASCPDACGFCPVVTPTPAPITTGDPVVFLPTESPNISMLTIDLTSSDSTPILRPTNEPSDSPSEQPSDEPSVTPSTFPSDSLFPTCIDSSTFTFTLDNGNKQNCAWLTKSASKITIRKNHYCVEVKSACPASCDLCCPSSDPDNLALAPADIPGFEFTNDLETIKNCTWLTPKNLIRAAKRKAKYCIRPHIHGGCNASCGYCSCADVPDFKFRLQATNTRVACNWITKNARKIQARRTKYCFFSNYYWSKRSTSCLDSCGFCTPPGETVIPNQEVAIENVQYKNIDPQYIIVEIELVPANFAGYRKARPSCVRNFLPTEQDNTAIIDCNPRRPKKMKINGKQSSLVRVAIIGFIDSESGTSSEDTTKTKQRTFYLPQQQVALKDNVADVYYLDWYDDFKELKIFKAGEAPVFNTRANGLRVNVTTRFV